MFRTLFSGYESIVDLTDLLWIVFKTALYSEFDGRLLLNSFLTSISYKVVIVFFIFRGFEVLFKNLCPG